MKNQLGSGASQKAIIGLLALMVGLGSFLRFYRIGSLPFWLDEAATYTYARSWGNLVTAIRDTPNGSLYFVLAHLWIRLFPEASDGLLRALSAIISVAGIPVVFAMGKRMTPNRRQATAIGLIAAFLVTINAFHIQYAQEFRSYSLTFLLTTLSTLLLVAAIGSAESKRHWLIWYTIVSAAAVYSHFYSVLIVAAQAATLPILLLHRKSWLLAPRRLLYSGVGMACLLSPIAVVAYLDVSDGLSGIPQPTVSTVKYFAKLITGGQGEGLFALYCLLGGAGLVWGAGLGRQDLITRWKFALMASCFVIPVVTGLLASILIAPMFSPKYALYVLPYLAVLTATGIVIVAGLAWKNARYRGISLLAGIGVSVLFVFLSALGVRDYYDNYQKTDWRTATQFLGARCSEALRLYYSTYVEQSVLRYDPRLGSQKAEWWINTLKSYPDANELAAALPVEYTQVCLVFSFAKDQEGTIRAAMKTRFPKVMITDFYEVEIDVYER